MGLEYGKETIKTGDTVGCALVLSEDDKIDHFNLVPFLPQFHYKYLRLVELYGDIYFEYQMDNYPSCQSLRNHNSKIFFYHNGRSLGSAYTQLIRGHYHAAVSVSGSASLRLNFGPDFKYSVTGRKFRPLCEAAAEVAVQHVLSDLVYNVSF
ncbi:hypothetical protein ACOME3_009136 [Neoechinorhynchus agilis]